ncbi:TonB-dependent receptor [Xanthomonas citri pv. glycines]|uniref:TonB-dependent receptor n=4 Tax=Xanthomonas TaxID=338 RepID=A0AA44Z5K6_XANCM|nr:MULTISPECIES: TonB-dependent receptor [Xanthomonas]OOW58687.1 ferric enterobactin receptor [Xanthomonas campestris pv. centellae]OOW63605.1 ferric enterobactin receptor [Xanthomonas campestris pv. thespesiae]OOW76437.1 ferric enterobactin receptor [Xanthomonas campestris pv. leeana]OOW85592.1 ferric enterobactin receptor [Xanthomonas campestris pv. vitistrifoliae]OOW97824.1 ferric enterobactin receptor [Xanthomonas campestris pv. vitiscarnosae]OOX20252.1 ferric enterobactin receptor [Xanth
MHNSNALSLAISVALTVCSFAASAQSQSTQPQKTLDTLIVTGTRVSDRTVAESESPIDIISEESLQATGATDVATALGKLLPSLNFPRPAIADGNDAARPATLRGLSPDNVLVLVDGKRYHTSSLVNYNPYVGRGSAPADLNSLPMSAIARIEVLRDGASAQYGSDAIAGVVNIVLKHGAAAGSNSISVNGGIMDKGDGAQNGIDGSVGLPFGATSGDSAPGWVRLSWNYQNSMDTNRSENTNRATTLAGAANPSGVPYQRHGDPDARFYQGLVAFGYNFTPSVELYGHLSVSRREVTSNGYYRAYDNSDRNVQAVYPNGFLPQIYNPINDRSAVLGVKGTTESDWHWDVSATYGKNDMTFNILNSINTNLYWSTGSSPTNFNSGGFETEQGTLNADFNKSFDWGLAYPVNLAFGVEHRQDRYEIVAGSPASYFFDPDTINPETGSPYPGGAQVFSGLEPSVAGKFGRHSNAAYAALEADLTDKLSGGIAGRYENYSDAGSTRSGKLSARYAFTDTFSMRATVSNGFRAPSLAQQNYASVVTLPQDGQLIQVGTYRTSDPIAVQLGARPLSPEKSTNYGIGSVWQPTTNFTSTLDVYQIRIWDQILYSDQIQLAQPIGQVGAVQFFVNGATSRTRGVDWVNSYRADLGAGGSLDLSASANYNKTKILELSNPNFGRASQGLLTESTPRTKYMLAADWTLDGFSLNGNATRYGAIKRISDPADGSQDQTYSARWILNLAANYTWQALTFTVGADNVTNQYPTKAQLTTGYDDRASGLQYSSLSPFGFNGRYWYGRVTYRF